MDATRLLPEKITPKAGCRFSRMGKSQQAFSILEVFCLNLFKLTMSSTYCYRRVGDCRMFLAHLMHELTLEWIFEVTNAWDCRNFAEVIQVPALCLVEMSPTWIDQTNHRIHKWGVWGFIHTKYIVFMPRHCSLIT